MAGTGSAMTMKQASPDADSALQELGEVVLSRDEPPGDAEIEGLPAEGFDRYAVALVAVLMEVRADQCLGFFEVVVEPGRHVGEITHRGGEHCVRADKGIGQALR